MGVNDMALGEKVVFDANRFNLGYFNDDSISITCQSQDEVNEAIFMLKKILGTLQFDEYYDINNLWDLKDAVEWISIYSNSNGVIMINSDSECGSDTYASDYYFKDISFDTFKIAVEQDELLDFLEA